MPENNKSKLTRLKRTKKRGKVYFYWRRDKATDLICYNRPTPSSKFPLGFEIDEEEIEEIDQDADYEELEIDAADADILEKFLPSAPKEKKTLADLIMEKINEKNAAEGREAIGKYFDSNIEANILNASFYRKGG